MHAYGLESPKGGMMFPTCISKKREDVPTIHAPIVVCTARGWYEYPTPLTYDRLADINEHLWVIERNLDGNLAFFREGLRDRSMVAVAGDPKLLKEPDLDYNMPYFYPRKRVEKQLAKLKGLQSGKIPHFDRCILVYFGDNNEQRVVFDLDPRGLQIDEDAVLIARSYWDAYLEYIAFPLNEKHLHPLSTDTAKQIGTIGNPKFK